MPCLSILGILEIRVLSDKVPEARNIEELAVAKVGAQSSARKSIRKGY
jgi:hypothetical protein